MISPELLQKYSFFVSLTDEQLKAIALIGEEKSFPNGTVLFEENTAANNLILLLEGSVDLFYSRVSEGSVVNSTACSITPGAIFGVSALIEPYKYTSSARATLPVKVVDIDGVALRKMAKSDQILDHALMRNVAAAVLARLH